ncbi:hypothetical protein BC829DRAFT_414407 [Chytridium lagenaria]|nr:hypothetical protein BC829DRAFT_414407 [Chytridium lagenaria]
MFQSVKAYSSCFGISELKRLNDCYIVGVGGSNLQTAAAQNDSLQLMMHKNNAIQRTMISNFMFLHKAQDEKKDSFKASLLSFKNILDGFDKKLTDIAKKLDSSFESGSGSGLPQLNTKLFLITAGLHHVCQGHYLTLRKTHRRLAYLNTLENQQAFLPKKNKEGLEVLPEVTQGLCHLEELTHQDVELITALQSAGVHL